MNRLSLPPAAPGGYTGGTHHSLGSAMHLSRPARAVVAALWLLAGSCGIDRERPTFEGEVCVDPDECASGLVCAHDGICRVEGDIGTTSLGGACSTNVECRIGLVCSGEGACAEPGDPGTALFGETCAAETDCIQELSCADGSCRGFLLPFWPGTTCPDPSEDDGPFRMLWRLPSRGGPTTFYGHPFPEDTRVVNGAIDMSGHPTPGPLIELLGDVTGGIADAVATTLDGRFGPNQAVFLRFSAFPDTSTLRFGLPGAGSIALVDLTDPDAAGQIHPFAYEITTARSPYICHNWMAAYPIDGRPLTPGHTYGLMLASSIRSDDDGSTLVLDADQAALLADTSPGDPALDDAWRAYQPLRDWMARTSVTPTDLGAVVVFTVQDVEARPRAVFAAAEAATLPPLAGAVACGSGTDPFAVAGDSSRGCATASDQGFVEIQGTLSLPQFQAGTPPFKDLADGGAIPVSNGTTTPARSVDVAVTLTVPSGDAPEGGWPVVLYAHGTGGSYTSVVRTGIAQTLSSVDVDGTVVSFATLGFDAPMHGPRAAPENHDPAWLEVDPNAYDPDVLFFNPLNPPAARDNVLQQAADAWVLARWLATRGVEEIESPTGSAIAFDPDHVYYLGHSQGGVVGTLFAAYDTRTRAVGLSGAGGLTIQSLLNKTSPNDLAAAIKVALLDPRVDRVHPVLNLVQALADGSDGVNFAKRVLRDPFEGLARKHVFMVSGVGDTYTPDATQYPLARALGLQQILNGNTPFPTIDTVEPPVSGNAAAGTTGVVGLYANTGEDAHFVLFDRDDARATMARFLATAVLDDDPTVE